MKKKKAKRKARLARSQARALKRLSKPTMIQKLSIDSLTEADYNPQKVTRAVIEDLKASILKFGFSEPIVVNKRSWDDGRLVIVGGHKRVMALRELLAEGAVSAGAASIPCVVKALSPEEEKALNVALNKIRGEFDLKKLAAVMEEIRESVDGASLTRVTGFKEKELTGLVRDDVIQAQKFGDLAEKFLADNPEAAKREFWLYCEPRNEQEFELVKKMLGTPQANRLLDMERVMQVLSHFMLCKCGEKSRKVKVSRKAKKKGGK